MLPAEPLPLRRSHGRRRQAKGGLNTQLTDLIAGAKRNATEYLKNTPDAGPSAGQFADKTQRVLMQQADRVARILLRKELIERDQEQKQKQ